MLLVFVLLAIIIIIFTILFLILASTLKIQVKKFEFRNFDKKGIFVKPIQDFDITLGLYLFSKIPLLFLTVNKRKIKKWHIKEKIKKVNFRKIELKFPEVKEIKDIVKNLDIKVETFKLESNIGLKDPIVTSAIVTILASIIPSILNKTMEEYKEEKIYYKIVPMYLQENVIKINFNCIIKIKMVHIITILMNILSKKRRVDNNGRSTTSHRRAYGYSYE